MKTLYIYINDGGDGSYYPQFTMNKEFIARLDELTSDDTLSYDDGFGDGDGFHYETLTVPDECTCESLGVSDCAFDIDEYLTEREKWR